jgi:hypothetical protein
VGILSTLIKAAAVFALLFVTIRLLRRLDGGRSSSGRPTAARRSRRLRAGAGRSGRSGGLGRSRQPDRLLEVVERASVGRASSLMLVRVQERYCMVGVTEQQVSLLCEVDVQTASPEADDLVDLRERERDRGRSAPWGELARVVLDRIPSRTHIEAVPTPELPAGLGVAGDGDREGDDDGDAEVGR